MQPIKQDIEILQGATFDDALQWCDATAVHKMIDSVDVGLPTVVKATGHGLTIGERTAVWITNVKGPRDLNTKDYRESEPRWASAIDADNLAVDFDSGNLLAYQSGGVLTYYPPLDLTGYSARMQIRTSVGAPEVLLELSTEDGGIAIEAANGTINRTIAAADTAAITLTQGVYDLELTDAGGKVTRLAEGAVTVRREVTR